MRTVIFAPTTDIVTQPRKSGVSTWPASVAVPPITAWTNSGTNAMAPKSATPTRNTTASVREITGCASRSTGRIGSVCAALDDDEGHEERQRRRGPRHHAGLGAEGDEQRADAGEEQRRAQPVHLHRRRRRATPDTRTPITATHSSPKGMLM